MLRVANILEEGRFTGQHSRIIKVAEKLKKEGVHTIVYFPYQDSAYFEARLKESEIDFRKLKIHRPTLKLTRLSNYLIFSLFDIFAILKQIKKDKVDVVHCNGSWQIKGAIAAKLGRKKVVWHLSDTHMPAVIKSVFSYIAPVVADYFILAGSRTREYYLDTKKLKNVVSKIIQAPVNTQLLNPGKVKSRGIFSEYSGLNITFIANINRFKGLEYFIDMVSALNQNNNNLHFHIIGSIFDNQKDYHQLLKDKIKKHHIQNVIFHGFNPNIESCLKESHIFVCSSVYEASPTTVWEAMAMACPIVSTDVGDVSSMIEDGYNGFIVSPGSGEELAGKVKRLIEDPSLRKTLGQRARIQAIKKLDVNICALQHKTVYEEVLNLGA